MGKATVSASLNVWELRIIPDRVCHNLTAVIIIQLLKINKRLPLPPDILAEFVATTRADRLNSCLWRLQLKFNKALEGIWNPEEALKIIRAIVIEWPYFVRV